MNLHEPNTLKVRMHHIQISREINPVKVMLTGDWHISPIVSERQYNFLREAIIEAQPDVIILQGDIVDSPVELKRNTSIKKIKKCFSLCAEHAKTVLVLGSHDFVTPTKPAKIMKDTAIPLWKDICKRTGVKLLMNEWCELEGIRLFGAFQDEKCMITDKLKFRDNPKQFLSQLKQYDFSKIAEGKGDDKVNWFVAHAPYLAKGSEKILKDFDISSFGHTHGGVVPRGLDEVFDKLHIHRGLLAPNRTPLPRRSRGLFRLGENTAIIVNPGMVGAQFCASKIAQKMNFLKAAEISLVEISKA